MRKYWLAALVGLLSFCSAVQAEQASLRLTELLKGFHTYQADFSQTTFGSQGRVLDRSEGVVMMERPGRFRWETQTPTHQILITSGETLWVYDVDLEQATQQKLSEDGNVNPASLLNGSVKNLTQNFNIEQDPTKPSTFLLKPKKANRNFRSIKVTFEHGRMTSMEVVNALDELSTFTFSHIKMNAKLSPTWFNFKAPAGVDVVKQ